MIDPLFSKGLQSGEYSIGDLLGDKSLIFCLDKKKESIVYMPLSNNDDFFIEPLLRFCEANTIVISEVIFYI
jgi:hypothetical protein